MLLTKLYTREGGIKETLVIALPMVISSACDVLMSSIDRFYLSKLDAEVMNAAMGGMLTYLVLYFFFFGIINFTTSLVAQYLGSGQKRYCTIVTTQALIIAAISYPVILLIRPLGVLFFSLMDLPPFQVEQQTLYYNLIVYGGVFTLFRTVFNAYFSGIGKTKIVMISTLVALVSNVGINYVLVFGKFGFPSYGIAGAAYGTIIANFISLVVLIAKYFSKENRITFFVNKSYFYVKSVFQKLLKFGFPQGLEMLLSMLGFNIFIFIFQAQGNIVSTATTIVFNWDFISFVPLIGIEIAVTSLVGRYIGANKLHYVKNTVISGILLGTLYSLFALFFFLFLPEYLVNIFKPQNESDTFNAAFPLAVNMIRYASLYLLFNAFLVCFVGALRGAGDTYWTLKVMLILHWALVGVSYVMFNIFSFTAIPVWLGMIIIIIIATIIVYYRYRSGKWKEIKLI